MSDPLEVNMDDLGGGEDIGAPPREIVRSLTQEDLEQKTWLTQENKEGIYEILAYNLYLEVHIGLRDRILDNLVFNAVTYGKSLEGAGINAVVGMAGAIHQQPSTNIAIGETLGQKLGGKP
jgi:hypothetical protein